MFSIFDRNKYSDMMESLADVHYDPGVHMREWGNLPAFDLNYHMCDEELQLQVPTAYSVDSDFVDYGGMMDLDDDMLLPQYMKFDIEKQPQLSVLVSPNDILPVPVETIFNSTDPFVRATYGNEMFSPALSNFKGSEDIETYKMSADMQEDLDDDTALSFLIDDKTIMREMAEDGVIGNIMEEILEESEPLFIKSEPLDESDPILMKNELLTVKNEPLLVKSEPLSEDSDSCDSATMSRKTYHPDYDHCYSKLSEDKDYAWTSAGSPGSSGSSSEVDVVTVTEELQAPFVPKVQVVPLRKRQKRGQKSPKGKKNQNSLSPKTFNAAMKRNMTRITTIRRTYRRKINNSVETTPSNSLPSSAPSSRCSSDVEDAGKRANHNSSERKRREVLRTALHELRKCVPRIQNNVKAPKVQILNCAKEFIRELCQKYEENHITKKNLKSKRKLLKMKMKKLRAEMGSSQFISQN